MEKRWISGSFVARVSGRKVMQTNSWCRFCITQTQVLERGTKVLQFDVCCEAIDQNFNCGCDRYAILHLYSLDSQLSISM